MIKLEVWASGNGSNAERLISYFKGHSFIEIIAIATDNPNAGVIQRAEKLNIPCYIQTKEMRLSEDYALELRKKVDGIILAGYLKLVKPSIIQAFENRIVNIHPSLLPKYGGKGMFGSNVHQAVLLHRDIETGITIHLVNEHFDEGEILAQFSLKIDEKETLDTLQYKIHLLEFEHFPLVVETHFSKYMQ